MEYAKTENVNAIKTILEMTALKKFVLEAVLETGNANRANANATKVFQELIAASKHASSTVIPTVNAMMGIVTASMVTVE